jgi:PleD family two-component response regulator
MLLPGEQTGTLELEVAAAAARAVSRSTDLLGWLGSDGILIVMPETELRGAEVAAFRWGNDMLQKSRSVGGHKWRSVAIDTHCDFETAEQIIQAAADRLGRREAA